MKIYSVLILAFFFFLQRSSAQQLSPIVISPSGGFYSNASAMLSFTVGEMSAVETFTSPIATLTQGFQQYWDFGTNIIEYPDGHFSFGIYPNLSDGHFNLVAESELNALVHVQILDLTGKEIFNSSFFHALGMTTKPIDISNAAPGMYLIVLRIQESKYSTAHHFIEKLQIIK